MNIKEKLLFLLGQNFSKLPFLNFSRNYVKQPDLRSLWFVFCVFVDTLWSNNIFRRLDAQYDVGPAVLIKTKDVIVTVDKKYKAI